MLRLSDTNNAWKLGGVYEDRDRFLKLLTVTGDG